MKIVTSITAWNDSIGKRISITYSEVNDEGVIVSDNKRVDRVVTDKEVKGKIDELLEYAQSVVEE